jgi:hypothetical protein
MSTLSFSGDLVEAMPREWLARIAALPGQSEASVTALLADIEHSLGPNLMRGCRFTHQCMKSFRP